MSNDLQLAFSPAASGNGLATSPWAGGPLGQGTPVAAESTPLHKAHRLLRGRYLLAIVLAVMGAAVGAAGGFLSQKPAYSSTGLIEIDPKVPVSTVQMDKVMVMASTYIQSTMVKLHSEKVIRRAMKDPKWQAVRPSELTDKDVADFSSNLTVAPPKMIGVITNTFIQVTYSENAKDAQEIAPIAVGAVIRAYTDLYSTEDQKQLDGRIDYWAREQKQWDADIEARRHLIETIAKNHEDDPNVIRAQSEQLILLKKTLQDAEEMYAQAQQDLKSAQADVGTQKFKPEDWARVDPTMEGYVKMRNELLQRVDSLESQLGQNHPVVIRTKQDLESREHYMSKYAEELATKFVIRWKPDGTGGALISKDLTSMEQQVQRLRSLYDRENRTVQEMREAAAKITTARDEIATMQTKYKQADEELRELNFQKEFLGPGRIRILSTGDIAAIDKDRRPLFAAAGFLGGAGLPIGLLLLIGLLDSRYRYSDETAPMTGGLALLGILPNLPDRLSDPEQAAIAAHCVHQIRTMLQINGGMEERRVFAVTSASPGDGKTSLTLALGLSYAACGTRTLLIDCDLIGAGLTSRMNVSAAEGVLEAIANRNLLQYVRQTDIADVALLPVGSAGNLHASTLSPASLRRMIEEAEKHFEIILIDTGPILGSIEASLVTAAADATVLVVARGQQRPMVEKSLSHLAAIGARLAGVVFNRAQAHDFERSISGVSMRSVGTHSNGRSRGGRLGPVARAVVTQVKPNIDGFDADGGNGAPNGAE